MKHIKKVNEIKAKYDKDKDEFMFNPSDYKKTVTFYLHRGKDGFAMEVSISDKEILEDILKRSNVIYTISGEAELPF
jgi:hypothetical protein